MKRLIHTLGFAVAGAAFVLVGCSDVKFKSIPQSQFIEQCTTDDIDSNVGNRCVLGRSVTLGSVDILFVNDNSGSMSFEQKKMADRFANLVTVLDNQNIDYNIAITTTDISTASNQADAQNASGALQDGKFIAFPNGQTVLKKSNTTASQRVDYFAKTIKRQETLDCETSGFSTCPSGDERGIYAINKVLDRGDSNFFRSNSLFATVILSDEDVRSDGGNASSRALEEMDLPETLVSRLGTTLGLDKSLAVYSLIVKPGDTGCKAIQDQQGVSLGNSNVKGFYGYQYERLSSPSAALKAMGNLVDGETASICQSDYGSTLNNIADKISTASLNLTLPCEPADEATGAAEGFDPLEIEVRSSNGLLLDTPAYSVNADNVLTFTKQIDAGSDVSYSVVCKRQGK